MLNLTKQSAIDHSWKLVDANSKTLGRIATEIAVLLVGKQKNYFVRHLDCGDHVVVINAEKIKVTGNKLSNKIYTRYSGYPGGLKKMTLEQLKEKNPMQVIRHAVWGMLPNNKLRDIWIKRLHVFAQNHQYGDIFK